MEEKNLMSWLNKANGWQRLWLVYAILVLVYALNNGFGGYSNIESMFVAGFLTAVIPYALGIAISWIIKGFKG
tara:strand:+ start:124 stop:342 length:219 start_codon:yes stop_codon:yes gene_type:complete